LWKERKKEKAKMNIIDDKGDNEQEQCDWLRVRVRGEEMRRLQRERMRHLRLEEMRRLQLERMRRLRLEEMKRLQLRKVRKQLGPIFDGVVETKNIDMGCMMKTAGIRREIGDFDNSDTFFRGEIDDDDDSDDDIPKFGSFKYKVKIKMEDRLSGTASSSSSSSSSSPAAKKAKKTMITDEYMDPFVHIDIEALTSLPTDRTNYL
jgi:hypothetical protein